MDSESCFMCSLGVDSIWLWTILIVFAVILILKCVKVLLHYVSTEKSTEDFEIVAMERAFIDSEEGYDEISWKPPISGCEGYVSFIDNGEDEPFYGCGETGIIWRTKEAFYRDIENIIFKYPHRKHFYEFKNGEWMPVDEVSGDIEDLIETESEETLTDFNR